MYRRVIEMFNPDNTIIAGIVMVAIGFVIELTLFEYFTDAWEWFDEDRRDLYKSAALIFSMVMLLAGIGSIITGVLFSL
jgi:hypothetical protein